MYLISPHKKQYKANLHCHSVISDGKKTPEELKEMYKSHGYSILSITDHETPRNHSDLNDSEFITITGYETYVRPDPNCIFDRYSKEIHINLFARWPDGTAPGSGTAPDVLPAYRTSSQTWKAVRRTHNCRWDPLRKDRGRYC